MSNKPLFYNKSEHGGYAPMPELSPYSKISSDQLKNFDQIHLPEKFVYEHADNPYGHALIFIKEIKKGMKK